MIRTDGTITKFAREINALRKEQVIEAINVSVDIEEQVRRTRENTKENDIER